MPRRSLARWAALPLALAACTATVPSAAITDSVADSMIGRSSVQVEARLGPPLSRNGSTLVYETRRYEPLQRQGNASISLGSGGASSSSLSMGRVTSRCQWQFRLDTEARVSSWQKTGPLCAALG